MARKIVIHYSSHLNISFNGREDYFILEDGEDPSEGELSLIELDWLKENVEVWAEVVDE